VEGTVVVDFADEVDGVALCVCGNADGCYRLVGLVDCYLCFANLRLLPPKEAEGVAIRVEGFRGVEADGVASLGRDAERAKSTIIENCFIPY